ncbi:MAG: winged helix-turn-helix transcriptional regulator [Actinomycetota bacterium]|jgi:DNA-binding HxlR family transcriptional regulator
MARSQYCPVSKGADLLGDRWTILIVRELQFGRLRFNEFERGLPGISRSVLSARLRRLTADRIIERAPDGGYCLTAVGRELAPVLRELGNWVATWLLEDPSPVEADPELLMLYISRHVNVDELPADRVVARFDFTGVPGVRGARRFWLVMERHDVSICLHDPGFPVVVTVRSSVIDFYRVYMGRSRLVDEIAAGRVVLEGLPRFQRGFHRWMKWSNFAAASERGMALRAAAGRSSQKEQNPC